MVAASRRRVEDRDGEKGRVLEIGSHYETELSVECSRLLRARVQVTEVNMVQPLGDPTFELGRGGTMEKARQKSIKNGTFFFGR